MRSKTLVTSVFAVSLAVAAYAVLNMGHKGDASVPREQVLAAIMELPAGTLLRSQDVTWRPVVVVGPDEVARPPAPAVEARPEIVEETAASLYGAVLRHPMTAGSPIRRGDIAKPGDRDFLQVVLPPGALAIAIPVATGGASTGLLSPGDQVDVFLTQNFKNDNAQDMRETPVTRRMVGENVVRNLRVLAIDAPDAKTTPTTANPAIGSFGRTVTLEVTPEQAAKVNVAAEMGKLTVALRSAAVAVNVDPVKPQWAGDVSPALLGAAQPKAVAVKAVSVQIFRGRITDKDLRSEIIKQEADTKDDKNR